MRSVIGASKALEELAGLMPSEAHVLRRDGGLVDAPLQELKPGDVVVVKPVRRFQQTGPSLKERLGLTSPC